MNTDDVTIRLRRIEDADSFWAALCSVVDERVYLAASERPPIERTRAFVTNCVEHDRVQFFALYNGDVIGWCDILPRDETKPTLGTTGMGLVAAWRGKGLGEKLLRTALDAARDTFETIELTVRSTNTNAEKLYRKVGFTHVGDFTREGIDVPIHRMIWHGTPS